MAKPVTPRHPEVIVFPNGLSTVVLRSPDSRSFYVYCKLFAPKNLPHALQLQLKLKSYNRFNPKHWHRMTSQRQFYNRFDRAISA